MKRGPKKGNIPWNKGKKGIMPSHAGFQKGHGKLRDDKSYEKSTKKISVSLIKYFSDKDMSNENSRSWKGEKAGYFAFHEWIRKYYGRANKCEKPNCKYPRTNKRGQTIYKPKSFQWALIHGKEHGHIRENYMMLCASCHKKYDMNLISIY